jgi:hypothetical protein
MLPENAPKAWSDRERLWNDVEAFEIRKDAQLAREVEFAIPREMSQRDGIELGSVEIQDSQIGMPVIQAPKGVWNAPIRFDGCSMGEDGAALFGQGHGPRPHRG